MSAEQYIPTHIRFIRQFVLETSDVIINPNNGNMEVVINQYHVQGGQLARIINIEDLSDTAANVTFQEGGPIVGIAYNLDKSNFEPFREGATSPLPDRGCCGQP